MLHTELFFPSIHATVPQAAPDPFGALLSSLVPFVVWLSSLVPWAASPWPVPLQPGPKTPAVPPRPWLAAPHSPSWCHRSRCHRPRPWGAKSIQITHWEDHIGLQPSCETFKDLLKKHWISRDLGFLPDCDPWIFETKGSWQLGSWWFQSLLDS